MVPTVSLCDSAVADSPVARFVLAGEVPAVHAAAAAAAAFTGAAETVCDILGGGRRVLLLGLGDDPSPAAHQAAGAAAAAQALRAPRLALDLRGLRKRDAVACLTGAVLRAWRYEALFSKVPEDAPLLAHIDGITDDPRLAKSWPPSTA